MVTFSTLIQGPRDVTYYECAWYQVLHLTRVGREIWWASQELSPEAAAIIKFMTLNGRMTAKHIADAFVPVGQGKETARQKETFDSTLLLLVEQKFLRTVHVREMKSRDDLLDQLREEEGQATGGVKTLSDAKRAKEIEGRVEKRLAAFEEEANSSTTGVITGKSELLDGRPFKRQKLEEEKRKVDESTVLRINSDKFLLLERNANLGLLAEKRLGQTTSHVYRHLLRMIEPKVATCKQDTAPMVVTTLGLSCFVPRDMDLESTWAADSASKNSEGKANPKQNLRANRRRRDDADEPMADDLGGLERIGGEDGVEDDDEDEDDGIEEDDEEDDASEADYDERDEGHRKNSGERLKLLNRHLDTLAQDSSGFLRKVGSKSMGQWSVDSEALSRSLRATAMEGIVQQKLGSLAVRLLRIVRDKGKIDEKQLATLALLKQKDIRAHLTALHEMGLLDLQEVPKRLDRQPSMTFFLWYHKPERAIKTLSADLYKTMSRVYQRLATELDVRKRLIEKSQRTDVRDKEQEYLSKDELRELRRIRMVEEKLLGQVTRLDTLLMILRDF